jgi:anti-anti-sigma factor
MDVQIHALDPGFICLRLKGQVSRLQNWRSADPLEAVLGKQGWPGKVVLDLQEAEYIDSDGIAWLMHWHRRAKEGGGSFGLCAVPARIDQVFRICQLHRILPIWENEAAARAALGVPPPPAS